MRINYPRQQHRRRRVLGILALLLVVGAVSIGTVFFESSAVVRNGYSVVAQMRLWGVDALQNVRMLWTPKTELLRENQALRDTILAYETQELAFEALQLENAALRGLADDALEEGVVARVVDYQRLPYGTLLVHVDMPERVAVGDLVLSGSLAIGTVVRIAGGLLTIELFIAHGNEESVLLGASGAATMIGQSGFGEVQLPRMVPVTVGDVVTLPRAQGKPIGVVAERIATDEDSLQTLLVEVPLRLELVRFVTIVHEY